MEQGSQDMVLILPDEPLSHSVGHTGRAASTVHSLQKTSGEHGNSDADIFSPKDPVVKPFLLYSMLTQLSCFSFVRSTDLPGDFLFVPCFMGIGGKRHS